MAANSLTFSPPLGHGQPVTHTQFNSLDANAAQAINRNSTLTGYRHMPIKPVMQYGATGTLLCYYTTGEELLTKNVSTDDIYFFLDELPHGHALREVHVLVAPSSGHGGQPANLPELRVYRNDLILGQTLLGSATHTWADIATYEAGFSLSVTGLNDPIDRAVSVYVCRLILESGVNSQAGLAFSQCRAGVLIDHSYAGPDLSLWV